MRRIALVVIMLGVMCTYSAYATSFATLRLDPVGSVIKEGQDVIFTGKFTTSDGSSIANRTIFILDDPMYANPDMILAVTTTDSNGQFLASWNATPKDNGDPFHFYARFIGGKTYGYARSESYETVLEKSDVFSTGMIPTKTMPMWFKNTSQMWSVGKIRDVDYGFAIQNMVDYGIIKTKSQSGMELKFPAWLKHDAMWLAGNQISNDDYIKALEYLLDDGFVKL